MSLHGGSASSSSRMCYGLIYVYRFILVTANKIIFSWYLRNVPEGELYGAGVPWALQMRPGAFVLCKGVSFIGGLLHHLWYKHARLKVVFACKDPVPA